MAVPAASPLLLARERLATLGNARAGRAIAALPPRAAGGRPAVRTEWPASPALARAVSRRMLLRDAQADIAWATDTFGLNLDEEQLASRLVGYCRDHRYADALAVIVALESHNRDDVAVAMFDGSADGGVRLTERNIVNMSRDPAARGLLERLRDELQSGVEFGGERDVRVVLTAALEDGHERRTYNRDRIEAIRAGGGNDLEKLAAMFDDETILDGPGTPQARLTVILQVTEHIVIPGLQTGVAFSDEGFAGTRDPGGPGFRDPHPSSQNQVGHFLTAVGLRVAPGVVSRHIPMFGSIREMVQAPSGMSDDDVALRLTIGHEKEPDPQGGVEVLVDLLVTGFVESLIPGPEGETDEQRDERIGRAIADRLQRNIEEIIEAFRRQFAATTDADVAAWNEALQNMRTAGGYDPAAMEGAQSPLNRIQVGTGKGNSIQDLRLSLVGYRFGEMIQQGGFATRADAAQWLRSNLGPR